MPGEVALSGFPASPGCEAGVRKPDTPERIHDAARQFESLLLAQILRSVRESEGGWLGSGGDSAGECASGYAEEQFAALLAQRGGLGLADLIAAGLKKGADSPAPATP